MPKPTLTDAQQLALPYSSLFAGADLPGNNAVHSWRQAGLNTFLAHGFPTPKLEGWKYTNLAPLARAPWALATPTVADEHAVKASCLTTSPTGRVCFVDGFAAPALCKPPVGFTSMGSHFDQALPHLSHHEAAEDALAGLNAAFATDGLLLDVPANTHFDHGFEAVFYGTEGLSNLRNLVRLGTGSTLTLNMSWASNGPSWHNAVTDIHLAADASLTLVLVQTEHTDANHTHHLHITLGKGAVCNVVSLVTGGQLGRTTLQVTHGENSKFDWQSAALARGRQRLDLTSRITHTCPGATSRQNARHVADGRGQTVFQGLYHVAQTALNTDAQMLNRNLLLSPDAKADSKPELEIYTDQVACSHGSSTGTLDEGALFYLQSRGLNTAEAKALLVEGFVAETFATLQDTSLRDTLHAHLQQWLGHTA